MADQPRHERRVPGRSKSSGITRDSKTGAFVEKKSGKAGITGKYQKASSKSSKTFFKMGYQSGAADEVAAAIERAFSSARAKGKAVRIGFTVDPSGAVSIASSILSPKPNPDATTPAKAAPEPIGPTLEAALSQARLRGVARIAEIIDGPEMKSADEFGRLIGATRETVNQKRRRHEVLGLAGPKRGVRFPVWQLTNDGGLLPGLPELFDEIGDLPWAVYRFLVAEHSELGELTGADAMKQGRVAKALALATSVGRGAAT